MQAKKRCPYRKLIEITFNFFTVIDQNISKPGTFVSLILDDNRSRVRITERRIFVRKEKEEERKERKEKEELNWRKIRGVTETKDEKNLGEFSVSVSSDRGARKGEQYLTTK